ncbi:DUF2478 domain-containing protein [Pusillimonas noertemannii]|uniref:DUF2478 domain-containing protein n=1 Tax=Pusillimonas noertemannii TaxID=305977 RepID=UPI00031C000D|nr:DUF2478 domain-containing protein [Pusillimonas noertemannii]
MNPTEETIAVAAIVHEGKGSADGPMLEFVQRLQSRGRVVRGLVPGPQSDPHDCATRTVQDLEDGTVYPIGQSLGKESKACCLDPGALLKAGVVLRRAIETGADLIIVNRFGILEADGEGFSAEMLELMTRGYPVLTVVSPPYLDAWREFTGGLAIELPPDVDEILRWFDKHSAVAAGRR